MNPLTLEWVEKAEEDFTAMNLLATARAEIQDTICFHAQQCIEKYLKACLQEATIRFSKTHDLAALLNLILPIVPGWSGWENDLKTVTYHAVDFRYPGRKAADADAEHAVQVCATVRSTIRAHLGLPT